ncbi:hypothetical protein ACIRRI_49505, partial [Streptomyces mirabilis]
QVIKLEQDRLVYQARLHSRFGRAWRRKAPVESLMPLRLARYGVPLAETAPAGLAAAGIDEPPILFNVERVPTPTPAQPEGSALETTPDQEPEAAELASAEVRPAQAPAAATERPRELEEIAEEEAGRFAEAYQAFIAQFQVEPTVTQWALWLRDAYGITTGAGGPLSEEQAQPLLQVLQERYAAHAEEPGATDEPQPADQPTDQWYDYFYSAWRTYAQECGVYPGAAALAAFAYERDTITGDGGRPITGDDLADFVRSFQEREFGSSGPAAEEAAAAVPGEQAAGAPPAQDDPEAGSVGAGAQAAKEKRSPRVDAAIDDPLPGPEGSTGERFVLTTVDRYHLAWTEYLTEHGDEPTAEQLSAYLAEQGTHGRGGKPVSPSTLRRYFLSSRVYTVWSEYRMRSEEPAADTVAQECAARGITAQYNKPVTPGYITENAHDFERRWHALIRYHADVQQ